LPLSLDTLRRTGGSLFFLHPDHLGSGTLLTDVNGDSYQFFVNLPFGETLAEQKATGGAYNNVYKFTGKELDAETGLYYLGARYYSPVDGIFLSVDPLAGSFPSWGPYVYTLNNPVRLTDPTGMAPESPEDWEDGNGCSMSEQQLQNVKVYIFYDPTPNGEDGGFPEQTMQQYQYYTSLYGEGSVALSNAYTENEFVKDWGDIAGSPELIVMNMHGTNQALHLNVDPDSNPQTLDGHYIVSTDSGRTNGSGTQGVKIFELPRPKGDISCATMYLNTCNSNNPNSSRMAPGTTLAVGFSRDTGIGAVRGTNHKVNFDKNGFPVPQWYYGGKWEYFRRGAGFIPDIYPKYYPKDPKR
jgi:RHS repeat-associated protein